MRSTGTKLNQPRTARPPKSGNRRSQHRHPLPARTRRPRRPATRRTAPPGATIRRVLVVGLVLALLGGAGWLVGLSSLLSAKYVSVTGSRTVDLEEIRARANVPLGVPLARQDVTAIAQRVATLPAIESSHVDRAWPNTLEISVVERTPVIAVRRPDGFALVDRFGVAYATVDRAPPNLPATEIYPGTTEQFAAVGTVATALPASLLAKVEKIRSESIDTISVVLKSGVLVNWGNADDSALKAQIVAALLKQKPRQIDVSAPHNPTTR